MNPVDALLREYAAALDESAQLSADAERAEHRRKIVFAQNIDDTLPQWKAEAQARASDPYREEVERLHEVYSNWKKARARAKQIRMRLMVWKARMALQREQMRLHGGHNAGS